MKRVRLVRRARIDLLRAFEYSLRHFGIEHAHLYTEALREKILSLQHHPNLGRPAKEDGGKTRIIVYRMHFIRYRIDEREIIVLGIVDARRDPKLHR